MPTARQLTIRKPLELAVAKVLIYGDPGIGKTRFLGTAQLDPRTSPMLVLDFEGGTSTLAGLDIDVAEIRDWKDFDAAYDYLVAGKHPYKSVAIDSVSETHWAMLSTLMDNRDPGTRKVENSNDQQEYGQALVELRRFMRKFRDLPVHVFYTAHAKDDKDPKQGTIKKPSLAGKAANEVMGIVSVTGYMTWADVGEGANKHEERVLVLKNYPKIRAKTRTAWDLALETPDELVGDDVCVAGLMDAIGIPQI
jgi:phage nucleotide-binding protein